MNARGPDRGGQADAIGALRTWLADRPLAWRDVARRCGCSDKTIRGIVRGAVPSADLYLRLVDLRREMGSAP